MATSIVSQNYTYDKLVALVTSYGERDDAPFVEQIPSFITLAENRLATEMKQQGFQCVVRGAFDPNNVLQKPAFWRETISFSYMADGGWQEVNMRSLEYIKQYWPVPAQTGNPRFYADYNFSNFYLAPTPVAGYEFELVYYARLDPLSEDHQQNWMTLNAPQALLYACLLEAALWANNNEAIGKWQGQYQQSVAGLLQENRERLADRSSGVQPR